MRRIIGSICLMALASAGGLQAQAPAPSAAPSRPANAPPQTRLEQLESTYNELLRGIHMPLLNQYLTDLQTLQSKALVASESAAVKAEIARVQAIIAGKGIVELDVPKAADAKTAGKVVKKSGVVFTLEPADASPVPADAASPDAVVPLGKATWVLSSLPAGSYDVVAHYACSSLPASAKVHVALGTQEFDREIPPAYLTKDLKTFRVMRLCQLTVKEEAVKQSIVLTAMPAGSPWIYLKQVLIVKSKSE